jgi:Anti-sigma-K factor rskA
VWDRIAAAVGADQPAAVPGGNGASRPAARGARKRRGLGPLRPRGRLATGLAGLAAGLIIGIGGTAGVVQLAKAPPARVVAQIALLPLPQFPQFPGTTGTAVMRAAGRQQLISVTLHAPRQPGFYEVWLLARDGVSMISLGDLNVGQTGLFTIPPGTDLRNYSRIDVSLQPFNGSTQHSETSVVRGSLPVVALSPR